MSKNERNGAAAEASQARILPADDIDEEVLDRDARRVVLRLQRHGFEAYFVGGCVRDLMIGRTPKDFDVATSATPQDVRRLFRNGRIIGRRFRLVHVYYGNHIIETATFRRDPVKSEGEDGDDLLITEDNVFGTAAEDARRRDFTVNGLFLDPATHEIHDYVNGLEDLEDRVLRTIGEPEVRMAEDPVRIMRAIKFATRLDFRIDDDTWKAMCTHAPDLSRSAPPRVFEEILRLLRSGSSLGAFRMLRACGGLDVLLPQISAHLGQRRGADDASIERAEHFWRLLEALDSEVHAGFEPSTSVAIAVLFLHVIERQADPKLRTLPGEPGKIEDVCWEVIEPVAAPTRLSRRDFGGARRIIQQQARFTEPQGTRFSPLLFALAEEFPEALDLFRLRALARGQGWDIYQGWHDRYERALDADQDEINDERRRIRRGQRKRRRRRR